MIEIFRNPEWKSIVIKVIVLQVLLAVLVFVFMSQQVGHINKAIVNQNVALIGHVLKKEPQFENEIIHYITQGAQEHEVTEGKRILAQYGYNEELLDYPYFALRFYRCHCINCFLEYCKYSKYESHSSHERVRSTQGHRHDPE
ncbi:hypothetical protein [Paenibacillus popilliae]|uniref:Signal transduction histidine kinase n=1 Tax=Paenibacillus popilliae ATCC 14706 TaxID=1212764 RepID=M9M1L7_PAEPP|nr:hypothetical protein [Paenibacillus popilliae]GAC42809.1 signal transduction histidine kinase [Paenibacillus popilliae ATCC 14706]